MMRLLFVDDEPRVLQGLRQSLRGKRQLWEMVFAGGGATALEEIERGRFDAVISDMRMPGIDGAELLRRVTLSQPHAFRVMLSGQMDESAAVRAAATAHLRRLGGRPHRRRDPRRVRGNPPHPRRGE